LERLIDLSQAAAEYLGVGVSWVHAEILVADLSDLTESRRPSGSMAS
jgi:rare lipoprotein A (peptidoglycan hydrolase)